MEILYLIGTLLFSILWFINFVQLLEKLHQGRDIYNQKILGCIWSVGLTFSIIISVSIFI